MKPSKPKIQVLPPKIVRPELLTHPNLPKPLHGLAPREVKGKYWWDKTRKKAYEDNNFRCMACGTHKNDALFKQHLEAHEDYSIDYEEGSMRIKEIVPLCHACHSFIHSGRLKALMGTKQGVSRANAKIIVERGMRILKEAKLDPFFGTAYLYCEMFPNHQYHKELIQRAEVLQAKQTCVNIQQDWTKWHLLLDGEKYYSKFKNLYEWEKFYGGS
jgi:hypothetical protein